MFILTKKWSYLVVFALFLAIFGWNLPVLAATEKPDIKDDSYQAKFIGQSLPDPLEMKAGETKTVTIKFKNTGDATWQSKGNRYVSAYTFAPKNRVSEFATDAWSSSKQTAAVSKNAKPGEVAELKIELKAPETVGKYKEEFYLAAENRTWIKGGYFFLTINVKAAPPESAKATVNEETPVAVAPSSATQAGYKANRFRLSQESVTAKGGEKVQLTVGYQNIGTATWKSYGFVCAQGTKLASAGTLISFADDSWVNNTVLLQKDAVVAPDDVIRETIDFKAPPTVGRYNFKFNLQVDGQSLEDTFVEIPVTVTENASDYVTPENNGEIPLTPDYKLQGEPRIRVGLWKPHDYVQVISYEDDYKIFNGPEEVGLLPKGRMGVFSLEDGKYVFHAKEASFTTDNYIRLKPANNPRAVFELLNYTHKVSWKGGSRNFNQYRGAVEYQLTKDHSVVYVINELGLEDYVAGIGEASNVAPEEFLKAQQVAARSYAYFVQQTSKHDNRNFDVISNTGDQLYLGYVCETISPNVVAATVATRGSFVTYKNNVVITPYFGHSNGKTKSWMSKWGGAAKPWLVPVKANYDKGLKMYGHGVGMSQLDAMKRAKKEGVDWQYLLKYYYTGIEIQKLYE